MRLFKDRNDRVFLGSATVALGAGVAIVLGSTLFSPQFHPERFLNTSATAASLGPIQSVSYQASTARGPIPLAHTRTKITKSDGAVSIVRDPTDLPPPIAARAPQRVKVELETVEVTGQLADGA